MEHQPPERESPVEAYRQLQTSLVMLLPLLLIAVGLGMIERFGLTGQMVATLVIPNVLVLVVFFAAMHRFPDLQELRMALVLFVTAQFGTLLVIGFLRPYLASAEMILIEILLKASILGALPIYLLLHRRQEAANFHASGFFGIVAFLVGVIPILLVSAGLAMIYQVLGIGSESNTKELMELMKHDSIAAVALPILVVVIGPIYEELFFRFLIFRSLRRFADFPVAAVASAMLFGLAHGGSLLIPVTAILGVIMAWTYERTESIWAPIMFHISWNGGNLLLARTLLDYAP